MKQIQGMWFPDGEQHFIPQLASNPIIDGKGTYQYNKYRAALNHVVNRSHAVDIGAHVGLWSRLMARDFTSVTAFEPLAEHVECFDKNLADSMNVQLYRFALDSKQGKLALTMPTDNTGSSHVSKKGEEVESRDLDSFHLKGIDFLKIDVEGYELPVILGGEMTIRKEKPVIIIEQKPNGNAERYGRERFAALDMLKSWGGQVVFEMGGDFLVKWK